MTLAIISASAAPSPLSPHFRGERIEERGPFLTESLRIFAAFKEIGTLTLALSRRQCGRGGPTPAATRVTRVRNLAVNIRHQGTQDTTRVEPCGERRRSRIPVQPAALRRRRLGYPAAGAVPAPAAASAEVTDSRERYGSSWPLRLKSAPRLQLRSPIRVSISSAGKELHGNGAAQLIDGAGVAAPLRRES